MQNVSMISVLIPKISIFNLKMKGIESHMATDYVQNISDKALRVPPEVLSIKMRVDIVFSKQVCNQNHSLTSSFF